MTAHVATVSVEAAVDQLVRLGIGSATFTDHVKQVAERHGVTERTVYRWLAARPANTTDDQAAAASVDDAETVDELIHGHGEPEPVSVPSRRSRFEIDTLHLAVYAHCRDAHTTWSLLTQKGIVDVSYPTFMRAIQRTDPARVAGALEGYQGLVRNRQYLRRVAPHRNHTLHADHTDADVWVIADHRSSTPIRPGLTVTTDGYSGLIHAFLWPTRPTGEMVAAALIETAAKHDYHGITLGGVPEQLVVDNGGENLAGVVTDAAKSLGWIISPSAPYSSWMNGKAERAVQLVNDRLSARAPGYLHGGATRERQRRFVANLRKDADPERMWSMATLQAALTEVVDEINTTIRVERLGGMTRLEAYAADPTEQRFVSEAELRDAMLTPSKHTYMVTKSGIQFAKAHYVLPGAHVGKRYRIRHPPAGRDFIEVFTKDDEYVGRAWRVDRLSEQEHRAFMDARSEVERENRAITAGAVHFRNRVAASAKRLDTLTGDTDLDADTDDVVLPDPVPAPKRGRKRRTKPNTGKDNTAKATEPALTDSLDLGALTEMFGDTLPGE